MSLISVIVPVYNTEKTLNRCIDSILNQTFCDWELLLVDDGSTDQSGELCDEYAAKDKRIRVFHKTNGGVSSARNMYNPQIQISVVSGTKRSIFRQKNKTKRSKKRLHTTLIKPEQKVNEDLCSGFIVS